MTIPTPATDAAVVVERLRASFSAGTTKPYGWRIEQLRGLKQLLLDNGDVLEAALRSDLGKHPTESRVAEIGFVLAEIDHAIQNLKGWLRPKRVGVPLFLAPAVAKTIWEPLGVVLIIGPFNYPVQLTLAPLVGALAAGNAVVVKPSELTPATSAALATLLPVYLDDYAVAVVEGGHDETTQLLRERFDHIFYTGSSRIARVIARAAAEHLTPTTLELGGKSPLYIDDSFDPAEAARRIAWGKFMNAGQTCVAPDYVLATPAVAAELVIHLRIAIAEFYGLDPAQSADYGRMVSSGHAERIGALISGHEPDIGGQVDAGNRYVAPTVINGVDLGSELMAEEIFGPILPIVHVDDAAAAIRVITERDKPLALYVFSNDREIRNRFLRDTSSGAVGFGIPAAHLIVPGLPFGGVGESGMGAYHGERSFTTFSHEKAILSKTTTPDTLRLIYPPFTAKKSDFIRGVIAKTGRRNGAEE